MFSDVGKGNVDVFRFLFGLFSFRGIVGKAVGMPLLHQIAVSLLDRFGGSAGLNSEDFAAF
jgi:hypothetical protein